ncbi:MAG TPA: helical backbone metal receptor [Alphaproteobacteria bacterium]|jgi:ABC-type Fe3+-hydroxamate transport system substrate-binding protein|nr:helical backbone metal receptor [Alphaproteobacteria bacterium]HJM50987.1 helical backbone metal receptor [Alphaproteobacteria bacterium]
MDGALIDAVGTRHEPASDPRIVSLVPSLTELLFELGLAEGLVGRTHYCVHPKAAVAAVTSVGGTKKFKLERLVRLAPSHVVVNVDENVKEEIEAIREALPEVAVVVSHPLEPTDNLGLYRLLGGIFGVQERAEELCRQLEAALEAVARETWLQKSVLYLIWRDPWMTISRDTYASRLLALVGWRTLGHDADRRYPEVSIDAELLARTDLVLLPSEPFEFTAEHRDAFVRDHPAVAQPLLLDGEMVSWYGSRAIQGVEYLAALAKRCGAG